MITTWEYGRLEDGRMVQGYRVTNKWGEFVEVLDYGAALHRVVIHSKKGEFVDVALHAQNVEHLQNRAREGFTIGRCANRIAYGRYEADGRVIQLETGPNGHYLHGGSGNYARQMFTGKIEHGQNTVCLYLRDEGMGGFDCPVDVWVRFTFDDNHTLTMAYEMIPHGTTLLCPANHAFFNLDGGGDIRKHQLHIPIAHYAPRTDIGMPEGEIAPVEGTVFDFQDPQPIGAYDGARYDDFYVREGEDFGLMAQICAPLSGIEMKVYANSQCLVFVTPPPRGENDTEYPCFCMETQYVPNAINCLQYIPPLYRKGEKLGKKTVYAFSAE